MNKTEHLTLLNLVEKVNLRELYIYGDVNVRTLTPSLEHQTKIYLQFDFNLVDKPYSDIVHRTSALY